jgi:trehalase-like protein/glycosyl hydrolase family 15
MGEAAKIGEYAAIGDGRSVALVSRAGDIDWLCWPRFDSPPLFWRLLDADRGGSWHLAPTGDAAISRRYVENSNVIQTSFDTAAGHATSTDAMIVVPDSARRERSIPEHEIVRGIRCDRGTVEVAMTFAPRPGFDLAAPTLVDAGRFGVRCETGRALSTLRGDRPVALTAGAAQARFLLRAGEAAAFSLSFDVEAPAVLPPLGAAAWDRIDETIDWWRRWVRGLRYSGRYPAAVTRSLLAIKLLSYAPSGAVIAAATTSLPERIGGRLNWDYRYCWLRDAAFTTRAMYALGSSTSPPSTSGAARPGGRAPSSASSTPPSSSPCCCRRSPRSILAWPRRSNRGPPARAAGLPRPPLRHPDTDLRAARPHRLRRDPRHLLQVTRRPPLEPRKRVGDLVPGRALPPYVAERLREAVRLIGRRIDGLDR